MKKVAFIGGGNLAYALVSGMVSSGIFKANDIKVSDPNEAKIERFRSEFKVRITHDNLKAIAFADVIILAVKPNLYRCVIDQIKDSITTKHLVISVAAGMTIDYLERRFDKPVRIVRTMPNIPASVHAGMTALSLNQHTLVEDENFVQELFNCVGNAEIIPEYLMDVVTAISGSSPAIVYMFIEALTDGAVLKGMNREQAYRFVSQAVLGSAKMVRDLKIHPGQLKDNVTSAGGTSIEAVYSLEKNGFRGIIMQAIEVCTDKAKRLTGEVVR